MVSCGERLDLKAAVLRGTLSRGATRISIAQIASDFKNHYVGHHVATSPRLHGLFP